MQAVVAFPLFLPFASVRGPTLALFKGLTAGPGGYVGITILATLFVILASSIWEGVTLQAQEHGDQYKCDCSTRVMCQLQCDCTPGNMQANTVETSLMCNVRADQ